MVQSTYIIITSGILGEQYSLQERGIAGEEAFKGLVTFAGRSNGVDSAAGKADAKGKVITPGVPWRCLAFMSIRTTLFSVSILAKIRRNVLDAAGFCTEVIACLLHQCDQSHMTKVIGVM